MDGEEYEVTEQNITFLKSSINVDDAYRVEFEKDSNTGLIYRAVINKRQGRVKMDIFCPKGTDLIINLINRVQKRQKK